MFQDHYLYRMNDLIPTDPEKQRLIPMSRSSWWRGVKEQRFPQPITLGPKTKAWKGSDLNKLIEGLN